MFRKTLITVWIIVFASVVVLQVEPRLLKLSPRPLFVFVFLVVLTATSLGYAVISLYRLGMKPSNKKKVEN